MAIGTPKVQDTTAPLTSTPGGAQHRSGNRGDDQQGRGTSRSAADARRYRTNNKGQSEGRDRDPQRGQAQDRGQQKTRHGDQHRQANRVRERPAAGNSELTSAGRNTASLGAAPNVLGRSQTAFFRLRIGMAAAQAAEVAGRHVDLAPLAFHGGTAVVTATASAEPGCCSRGSRRRGAQSGHQVIARPCGGDGVAAQDDVTEGGQPQPSAIRYSSG